MVVYKTADLATDFQSIAEMSLEKSQNMKVVLVKNLVKIGNQKALPMKDIWKIKVPVGGSY